MITPNTLTLIRITATPLFILFFMINTVWSLWVCLFLFIIFEMTDLLDGRMARQMDMVTDFGKLMDPFADSISRFTIFLCFLGAGLAPIWTIAIFFYRDVLVSVIRVFSIKSGVVVAARQSGKIKALIQAGAIGGVLIIMIAQRMQFLPTPFNGVFNISLATELIFLAAMGTLWSGIDYWVGNKTTVLGAMNTNS